MPPSTPAGSSLHAARICGRLREGGPGVLSHHDGRGEKAGFDRRSFFSRAAACAAPLPVHGSGPPSGYRLRYAPHIDMGGWTGGKLTPEEQLEVYACWGFRAFEFNTLARLAPARIESLRKKMNGLNMAMGVFTVNRGGWAGGALCDKPSHAMFLEDVRRAVATHRIAGNECATVYSGPQSRHLSLGEQTRNCAEALKRAADIVSGTSLVLALKPLNTRVDHPGYFVSNSDHAAEIAGMVNSPNVKILFDIYHQQISEGNIMNRIRDHWDLIAYFQAGDVPGRMEPYTGEVNWQNIFRFIHDRGYKGIIGMEHGLSVPGRDGLKNCFEAYRRADCWSD